MQGTTVKKRLSTQNILCCFWAISCSQDEYVPIPVKLHYWEDDNEWNLNIIVSTWPEQNEHALKSLQPNTLDANAGLLSVLVLANNF